MKAVPIIHNTRNSCLRTPVTCPPVAVFDRVFAHAIGVEAVLIEAKVQLNAVKSQRCRGKE